MELIRLRGTVRIWISCQYERVIHFLSRRGYINSGVLSIERPLASMHPVNKVRYLHVHVLHVMYSWCFWR